MDTSLDYESIETFLGDRLRRQDNLDIHADHFFPVSLLDKLFHYSEDTRGTERDNMNRPVHRNFHGHDFNRWIDNLIAHTRLPLIDEEGNRKTVDLVDIDALIFKQDSTVTVSLPDETSYTLLSADGKPLHANGIDSLKISLDLSYMFDRPPVDNDSEPYLGFGTVAHLVRVVCEKSGLEPDKVNPHTFTNRLFEHFKNEMLPLIPSLWNDMEHIMHYARPQITVTD